MVKMYFSTMFAFLVVLHVGLNPVEAVNDEVFFGTGIEEYVMPADCEGRSYCFEKGDNYPDAKIAELLTDMRDLTVDTGDQTSVGERRKREVKQERPGESYDEPECPFNSTNDPIYYITDESDRVRVVVQSSQKFMQIYTVNTCLKVGRIDWDTPHFSRSSRILRNFNLECVQTNTDFDFFVLSDNADPFTKPKMEVAKAKGGIPVCCKCQYRTVDD